MLRRIAEPGFIATVLLLPYRAPGGAKEVGMRSFCKLTVMLALIGASIACVACRHSPRDRRATATTPGYLWNACAPGLADLSLPWRPPLHLSRRLGLRLLRLCAGLRAAAALGLQSFAPRLLSTAFMLASDRYLWRGCAISSSFKTLGFVLGLLAASAFFAGPRPPRPRLSAARHSPLLGIGEAATSGGLRRAQLLGQRGKSCLPDRLAVWGALPT